MQHANGAERGEYALGVPLIMRFLVPVGGVTDHAFGVLTTYRHTGVPSGIIAGLPWAADNCAYGGAFDGPRYLAWLETMLPYRATCLFVAAPDVVGDAIATLTLWQAWQAQLSAWPLAFVNQDGQIPTAIPNCAAIFVGGTTTWKLSETARACIAVAQQRGCHIHIGRVNWWRRYAHFRAMPGSDSFTCDGTRTHYEGVGRTLEAWKQYQQSEYQAALLSTLV